jgi:hypothetical protein
MKKIIIFSCLLAAVVLSSCSKKTYSYAEARTVEPTQSVTVVPVVAELEVSAERITYAERLSVKVKSLSKLELQALVEKEKVQIISNAASAHDADLLVAPVVSVQTDVKSNLIISVTGYPAKYKNYRSATKEDKWFLESESSIENPIIITK